MAGTLDWLDPQVERFVLPGDAGIPGSTEGREVVGREIHRHWMAAAGPTARIALALIAFSTAWLLGGLWLLLLIAAALGLIAQALWQLAGHHRDRFVITDRRVFRVHGNLSQERASLPLSAIAGVDVQQSPLGRFFGYGRLRFVAAVNDQGLTDVRWVPDAPTRAEEIRALVAAHRSGAAG